MSVFHSATSLFMFRVEECIRESLRVFVLIFMMFTYLFGAHVVSFLQSMLKHTANYKQKHSTLTGFHLIFLEQLSCFVCGWPVIR